MMMMMMMLAYSAFSVVFRPHDPLFAFFLSFEKDEAKNLNFFHFFLPQYSNFVCFFDFELMMMMIILSSNWCASSF